VGWSEKSYIYLLAAQLCLYRGLSTLVPSLLGLFFGWLYNANILNLQAFRLPARVENVLAFVGGILTSIVPSGAPTRQQQLQQQQRQAQRTRNPNATRLVDWDPYGNHADNYGWDVQGPGTGVAATTNTGQQMHDVAPPSESDVNTLMVSLRTMCLVCVFHDSTAYIIESWLRSRSRCSSPA
jgi:hypothetical protein